MGDQNGYRRICYVWVFVTIAAMMTSCAIPVRAYPPHDAQGEPTPMPVIMKQAGKEPVEPGVPFGGLQWTEILLSLLGVKVGGDLLKGGVRVAASKLGRRQHT